MRQNVSSALGKAMVEAMWVELKNKNDAIASQYLPGKQRSRYVDMWKGVKATDLLQLVTLTSPILTVISLHLGCKRLGWELVRCNQESS